MPRATLPDPNDDPLRRILQLLERVISEIPETEEAPSRTPDERAREIGRNAAIKAGMVSGGLALPPGPLGLLTILPDLYAIWKIQGQMVADIAGAYGKKGYLNREQMLYCLFRHAAAQALRDIAVRLGERILIRRPALRGGVGAYAYYDTGQVADTAIDLFRREIELDAPRDNDE
jgi:hypothetical protein